MKFEMILPPNLVHVIAGHLGQSNLDAAMVVNGGSSQYKWDNLNGLEMEAWLAMIMFCHLGNIGNNVNDVNKDDYIPFLKLNEDVQEWVNNNISDVEIKIDVKEKYYDWPVMIVFSNKDDAMMFRLRWGNNCGHF